MTKRVLIGSIKQESNAFNRFPTPLSVFEKQGIYEGQAIVDAFAEANLELGGFMEVGAQEGWEIIPAVASFAPPAGPVEDAAFDHLCGKLIDACKAAAPLDGVLLALHGSMVVVSHVDAETEIVRRVRAVVGDDIPLCVSLDPHCNIGEEMAEVVQGMYAFRTSPHIDQRKTGIRAAQMLAENFRRGKLSRCVLSRLPMLMGFDGARTYHDHGPFHEAIALAAGFEAEPDVLAVSIHAGYSKADCPMIGPSVAVSGFTSAAALRDIADAMMEECWRTRNSTSEKVVGMKEAAEALAAHKPGDKPVVLGDYGDSQGGGAYGDGTALLSLLLDSGAKNAVLTPIFDAASVREAMEAGEGATVSLSLGGKSDPSRGGGPVEGDWKVLKISDGKFRYTGPYGTGTTGTFGDSVLLQRDGVKVIVVSVHKGIYDQSQLRIYGVEPAEQDVLVLKSMQGYRGDFQHLASVCLDVDSGGITSPDPALFDWKHIPRPIWPLDDITHERRRA
jgi:microcystin degradation protein MlrC